MPLKDVCGPDDIRIVGLADRDYMRTPGPSRPAGSPVLLVAIVLFLGIIVFSSATRHWLQARLSTGKPRVYTIKPFGVGSAMQVARLYPAHDRWGVFLPKPEACAGSTNASASTTAAEAAMICALNYARVRNGLGALPVSPLLQQSARLKALDIIRCEDFSHSACGKEPHAVADEVGYPNVDWGENIYEGPGPFAAARVAADGWLNSPDHRENLFRAEWTEQGVSVVIAKHFKGQNNVAIWVSEFGAP
jgi:uncharacterized protein YkwD